jgi:hypothetical protein
MEREELILELSRLTEAERDNRYVEIQDKKEEELDEDKAQEYIDQLEAEVEERLSSVIRLKKSLSDIFRNQRISFFNGTRRFGREKFFDTPLSPNRLRIVLGDPDLSTQAQLKETLNGWINTYSNDPDAKLIVDNMKVVVDNFAEVESYAASGKSVIKTIKIDSYLGGIPLGPMQNREAIYDYWEKIHGKYDEVEEALHSLIKWSSTISGLEYAEELSEFKNKDLRYISEYEKVDANLVEPIGRFFDYQLALVTTYSIDEQMERHETEKDDEGHGDLNAELLAEAEARVQGDEYSLPLDPALTDSLEDDNLEDAFKSDYSKIDPLLAYYGSSDKIVAVTEKGFDELRKGVAEMLEIIKKEVHPKPEEEEEATRVNLEMSEKIQNEIDAIQDTLKIDREEFYLPYTLMEKPAFKDSQPKQNPEKRDIADIMDFLDTVGNLLYSLNPQFPTKGVKANMSADFGGQVADSPVEGAKGIPTFRKELKRLLEAIDEYYFAPSYSGRAVIEQSEFINGSGAKKIMTGASNVGVQMLEGTAYEKLIESRYTVRRKHLVDIFKFLNEIVSGSIDLTQKLTHKAEDAAEALTDIFGHEDENMNHMAALLNYVYEETDSDVGAKRMNGKLISDRADQYAQDYSAGKPFPLFILPFYLQKHKGLIARTGMKRDLGKLEDLLRSIEDLPIVLKSLLKAHDILRKMKGLEVPYAFRPLTINHSEEVINKMYSKYNVDLAHAEIDKIVTEVDSFANIAKSLGVSEEIVYQVKAQFR